MKVLVEKGNEKQGSLHLSGLEGSIIFQWDLIKTDVSGKKLDININGISIMSKRGESVTDEEVKKFQDNFKKILAGCEKVVDLRDKPKRQTKKKVEEPVEPVEEVQEEPSEEPTEEVQE